MQSVQFFRDHVREKAKEAVGQRRHHGRRNGRKKRECRRPFSSTNKFRRSRGNSPNLNIVLRSVLTDRAFQLRSECWLLSIETSKYQFVDDCCVPFACIKNVRHRAATFCPCRPLRRPLSDLVGGSSAFWRRHVGCGCGGWRFLHGIGWLLAHRKTWHI
jgi:hypothetical protein